MAAAVADHRPKDRADVKLKKEAHGATIELVENPDLLRTVGVARKGARPVLVGFAVETGTPEAVAAYARKKLASKKVDLVVANAASDAFGRDDNVAIFVSPAGDAPQGTLSKDALADRILDFVVNALAR
ncbi:MAG: phosphopantothenoylcysteine decarboxylase [Polyangiaceae bacterium]